MVSFLALIAPPKPVGRTARRLGFRVTMPFVSSAPNTSENASNVSRNRDGSKPRELGTALTLARIEQNVKVGKAITPPVTSDVPYRLGTSYHQTQRVRNGECCPSFQIIAVMFIKRRTSPEYIVDVRSSSPKKVWGGGSRLWFYEATGMWIFVHTYPSAIEAAAVNVLEML